MSTFPRYSGMASNVLSTYRMRIADHGIKTAGQISVTCRRRVTNFHLNRMTLHFQLYHQLCYTISNLSINNEMDHPPPPTNTGQSAVLLNHFCENHLLYDSFICFEVYYYCLGKHAGDFTHVVSQEFLGEGTIYSHTSK